MLRSIHITAGIFLVCSIILCSSSHASMDFTIKNGLNLGWYFHNDSTAYTVMECRSYAYYRDFDKDGKQDFMIELRQPLETIGDGGAKNPMGACKVRYFAINTATDGKAKTYAANRTAWRDLNPEWGTFVPSVHCFTGAASILYVDDKGLDYPDIIASGDNRPTVSGTYTSFVFRRLDGTTTSLPTLKQWSIPVDANRKPVFIWLKNSANSDTYPDYLVYHQIPDSSKKFKVTCYNGKTGTDVIWTASLSIAADDPNTGITYGTYSVGGKPEMQVIPLASLYSDTKDDFDSNGKPEILLYYTFGTGDMMGSYAMHADITMLSSSGAFLSPYSSTWVRAADTSYSLIAPMPYCSYDLNDDQYLDLLMVNSAMTESSSSLPPLFRAYNLKGKSVCYSSVNTDFGHNADDLELMTPGSVLKSDSVSHGDVNGDGKGDLLLYRPLSDSDLQPIRIGAFHGNAGGSASLKGRKMYLSSFSDYTSAFPNVNDFNKDGIMDLALGKSPVAPNDPISGEVTWNIGNVVLGKTTASLTRAFTYSTPHNYSFNPHSDHFQGEIYFNGLNVDLDGDGQRDTCCCCSSSVDNNDDGTIDQSSGHLIVYDNHSGSGAPPINAEMEIRVTGENWEAAPLLTLTRTHMRSDWVDNNRDGKKNDFIIPLDEAVFYVSAKGANGVRGDWEKYK